MGTDNPAEEGYIKLSGTTDATSKPAAEGFLRGIGGSGGAVNSVSASDTSLTISPTTGAVKAKARISQETGNALVVKTDGLFVSPSSGEGVYYKLFGFNVFTNRTDYNLYIADIDPEVGKLKVVGIANIWLDAYGLRRYDLRKAQYDDNHHWDANLVWDLFLTAKSLNLGDEITVDDAGFWDQYKPEKPATGLYFKVLGVIASTNQTEYNLYLTQAGLDGDQVVGIANLWTTRNGLRRYNLKNAEFADDHSFDSTEKYGVFLSQVYYSLGDTIGHDDVGFWEQYLPPVPEHTDLAVSPPVEDNTNTMVVIAPNEKYYVEFYPAYGTRIYVQLSDLLLSPFYWTRTGNTYTSPIGGTDKAIALTRGSQVCVYDESGNQREVRFVP